MCCYLCLVDATRGLWLISVCRRRILQRAQLTLLPHNSSFRKAVGEPAVGVFLFQYPFIAFSPVEAIPPQAVEFSAAFCFLLGELSSCWATIILLRYLKLSIIIAARLCRTIMKVNLGVKGCMKQAEASMCVAVCNFNETGSRSTCPHFMVKFLVSAPFYSQYILLSGLHSG